MREEQGCSLTYIRDAMRPLDLLIWRSYFQSHMVSCNGERSQKDRVEQDLTTCEKSLEIEKSLVWSGFTAYN